MWRKIAQIILKNRVLLTILVALVTIFMAFQAKNVQMSYKYSEILPKKDSIFIDNQRFVDTFGSGSDVITIGINDPDFFQLSHFNRWRKLSQDLKHIEGVEKIFSASNSYNLKKNKKERKFEAVSIFSDDISSQVELDSMVLHFKSLGIYKNALYSSDAPVYLMAITVNKSIMETVDRERLVKEISETCDQYRYDTHRELMVSGIPYIRVMTAQKIKSEFFMFILLALATVIIILYLFFRSIRQVVLPMVIVTIGVIWCLGFMSILNFKITLLTAMLPPLLIVIGIPNCIFLMNKYHSEYLSHGDKKKALRRTIQKIGNATLLTNLTTASGFATFLVTSSKILREFGLVASLSIMTVFITSLIIIPNAFSFLNPPKEKDIDHLNSRFFRRIIDKLIHIVLWKRPFVFGSAIVILFLGFIGISKMKSTGYMVDDLPENSPIMTHLKFFEKHFDGLMPLEISIDTRKANGVMSTSVLSRMDKLSNDLEKLDDLSSGISIIPMLKFSKQAYYNGNPHFFKLPTNQEKNFILSYAAKGVGGDNSDQLHSFIDKKRQKVRLSFRMKDVGTEKMNELTISIREKVHKYFPKNRYDVSVTGATAVFVKGTQYLVNSLFQSLGLAILLIAIFMALMFNSRAMVLLSLVPNILPLVFTAAVMGYLGIPIKASTILVFSIAFGISVDDTIHFLAKYRQELLVTKWDIKQSVVLALRETGISMIYTSIVLFFGFGIFSFSSFGGTVALGILVSLTLLVALFSNLIFLPSLLMWLHNKGTRKGFQKPFLKVLRTQDNEENI